ncbi:MAG: subtilisin-like proprotein convertase family protein, partial [Sphingobacteriales bacterium]
MRISKILSVLFLVLGLGVYAQPANDNCGGAIGLTVDASGNCSSLTYNNVGATPDGQNPSCWNTTDDNGIWFSFVAPATGSVMISDNFGLNSINDPHIAVFEGGCGALNEIACQEDINTGSGLVNNRLAVYNLTPGNTYHILLDGNNGEVGDVGICLEEIPPQDVPEYSDCVATEFICSSDPIVQANFNGTQGNFNEPGACYEDAEQRSHWYEFTVDVSGQLAFSITPNAPVDYDWAVWDITNGCPGVELACSWTSCLGNNGAANGVTGLGCPNVSNCGGPLPPPAPCDPTIGVIAGRRYVIMVDRYATGNAGYVFDLSNSTFGFGGLEEPDFSWNGGGCGQVDFEYLAPSGTLEFLWDFGDGGYSTEKNPSHSYAGPGTYDVTLIIKALPGECSNSITKQVTISGGTTVGINPVTPFCPGESRVLNSTVTPTSTGNYNKTFSNNNPVAVVSNATRNSPITASCLNPNDWSIVRVCMNISHTYMGDMQVRLVAPNGTLINLANRIGGTNDGYVNTCFTNGGNPRVNTGAFPYTGDWSPQQNPSDFSGFTGFDPNGTWNLRVNDNAAGDNGTIENWTIT